jgi:hypothetical protein
LGGKKPKQTISTNPYLPPTHRRPPWPPAMGGGGGWSEGDQRWARRGRLRGQTLQGKTSRLLLCVVYLTCSIARSREEDDAERTNILTSNCMLWSCSVAAIIMIEDGNLENKFWPRWT